jgi:hypothetical protein
LGEPLFAASAEFFLLRSIKEELDGFRVVKESLKNILLGVSMNTAWAMFAMALWRFL